MSMDIIILSLIAISLIPVVFPLGKRLTKESSRTVLLATHLSYTLCYLFLLYAAYFLELYFGLELGDLYYYLIFSVIMIILNVVMWFRNKFPLEVRKQYNYIYSVVNILSTAYLVTCLLESNLLE